MKGEFDIRNILDNSGYGVFRGDWAYACIENAPSPIWQGDTHQIISPTTEAPSAAACH